MQVLQPLLTCVISFAYITFTHPPALPMFSTLLPPSLTATLVSLDDFQVSLCLQIHGSGKYSKIRTGSHPKLASLLSSGSTRMAMFPAAMMRYDQATSRIGRRKK